MAELIKGQQYRWLKEPGEGIHTHYTYCGTEEYQGKIYHNFYDPIWQLFHWLEADEVERTTDDVSTK